MFVNTKNIYFNGFKNSFLYSKYHHHHKAEVDYIPIHFTIHTDAITPDMVATSAPGNVYLVFCIFIEPKYTLIQ